MRQNSFKIETTLKNLKNDAMTENFPRSELFLLSLHWPGKFMLIFIIINMRLVNLSTLLFENMGQFANLKKKVSKMWGGKNRL